MNKSILDFIILGASSELALATVPLLLEQGNVYAFSRNKDICSYFIESPNYNPYFCLNNDEIFLVCNDLKLKNIVLIDFRVYKDDSLIYNKNIDNFKKEIDVNIIDKFVALKFFIKKMIKNNFGRVIHLGSKNALSPNSGQIGYSISKIANVAFSNSIASECKKFNITSNILDIEYYNLGLFVKLNSSYKDKILINSSINHEFQIKNFFNSILFIVNNDDLNNRVI